MCCKRINVNRDNISLIDVYEEKLGECECDDVEIIWEDGRWVVELGVLVKGFEVSSVCKELKNIVEEKRYGWVSLFYV